MDFKELDYLITLADEKKHFQSSRKTFYGSIQSESFHPSIRIRTRDNPVYPHTTGNYSNRIRRTIPCACP